MEVVHLDLRPRDSFDVEPVVQRVADMGVFVATDALGRSMDAALNRPSHGI